MSEVEEIDLNFDTIGLPMSWVLAPEDINRATSQGLRIVAGKRNGKDSDIRIFVDPGVYLVQIDIDPPKYEMDSWFSFYLNGDGIAPKSLWGKAGNDGPVVFKMVVPDAPNTNIRLYTTLSEKGTGTDFLVGLTLIPVPLANVNDN